jgi:hypothetical protein
VPTATTTLVNAGGCLLAIGLVLFAAGLRGMQRRSLQRARWALRWYQASAACLALGGLCTPGPPNTGSGADRPAAGVAIVALALSHAAGLGPLTTPASAVLAAIAGLLAIRILTLALRGGV